MMLLFKRFFLKQASTRAVYLLMMSKGKQQALAFNVDDALMTSPAVPW